MVKESLMQSSSLASSMAAEHIGVAIRNAKSGGGNKSKRSITPTVSSSMCLGGFSEQESLDEGYTMVRPAKDIKNPFMKFNDQYATNKIT